MDFDFNIILVPLTLGLAIIWLLDIAWWHFKKQRGLAASPAAVRWAYEYLPILAVVLVVRSFIIEPFNIPSSSMVPTLYTGDFITVNKYAYGLRLPLLNTKVVDIGSPQRGDVAVFRFPPNPKVYYIKRVIGVGGDTVGMHNGQLVVNGQPVPTVPVNYQADPTMVAQMYPAGVSEVEGVLTAEQAAQKGQAEELEARYQQESPAAGHTHLTRHVGNTPWYLQAQFLAQHSPEVIASRGQDWQITVPQGQYFVMGDNRDRSFDGRFWGFVPDENLSGKASYIWMHKAPGLQLPTFAHNKAIE